MRRILITGSTGNVGLEIVKSLHKMILQWDVIAGLRDVELDQQKLAGYKIGVTKFDFTDIKTYKSALQNCIILFLLRPPQITDVKKYFVPLIGMAKQVNVRHIVFLSVQGVEKGQSSHIIK